MIKEPKETEFKSFDDIFDHFEGITFRTLNSLNKKVEIEPVRQHKYEKIWSQSPAKQREYEELVMPTTNNLIHQQLSALSLSTHEQNELIQQRQQQNLVSLKTNNYNRNIHIYDVKCQKQQQGPFN
jgi:hypothetical protein